MSNVTLFDQTDVVPLMSADEARECIAEIKAHEKGLRARVFDLYERRGWDALGYTSWRECVLSEFDSGQATLYQELTAAKIERQISAMAEIGTIPERQLRPLAPYKHDPEAARAIWDNAHRYAEAEGAEKLSTRHVKEAVREWRHDDHNVFTDPEAEVYQEIVEARDERPTPAPMAVHFSSETPEWYTPSKVLDLVREVLGQIDLDPCSNSDDPEIANVPALHYYTQETNGLDQRWFGNVYMNPPYGDEIPPWIDRLVRAWKDREIRQAIALVPGRVDTAWFQPLWEYPLCFVRGRLRFVGGKDSAPFPSVLAYLGDDNDLFMDTFERIGRCGILK